MTKEQLWQQQERTWADNNVFVTTETAWMAGFETAMARTCMWVRIREEVYAAKCSRAIERRFHYENRFVGIIFCPNCGGRVKEAK